MIAILRHMGGLVFDATFNEAHESTLEVTDNPIETGVVVSDHAFMNPLRYSIIAGVSDSPFYHDGDVDMFDSSAGRSRLAWELLTELQRWAEPFEVQSGLKLYTNMLCISITAEQDKDSAGVLFFTAQLREIIIVNTRTVLYAPRRTNSAISQDSKKTSTGGQTKPGVAPKEIKPRAGVSAEQAQPNTDAGEQQVKPVTPEKRTSLLKQIGQMV